MFIAAGCIVGALFPGHAQTPQPGSRVPKPLIGPEANRLPDANERMEMQEGLQHEVKYSAANAERLRQMERESENLVTMAMALKAEVDSTPANQISANAIRKAEVIERMAHGIEERMKLTITPH